MNPSLNDIAMHLAKMLKQVIFPLEAAFPSNDAVLVVADNRALIAVSRPLVPCPRSLFREALTMLQAVVAREAVMRVRPDRYFVNSILGASGNGTPRGD